MVQVVKDLGIEFVAANPGSSFEGLQESFINYGNPPNTMPEFITALHEESAVTMAHGYAKAEGKPMLALLHGTIGIQHAAMSIYQAYQDKVPVLMIAGNDPDFIAAHTAHDMGGMVRSYTKWDAQSKTLDEALRARSHTNPSAMFQRAPLLAARAADVIQCAPRWPPFVAPVVPLMPSTPSNPSGVSTALPASTPSSPTALPADRPCASVGDARTEPRSHDRPMRCPRGDRARELHRTRSRISMGLLTTTRQSFAMSRRVSSPR